MADLILGRFDMSQRTSDATTLARSLRAKTAFQAHLRELGAQLLDTEWRGSKSKYRTRCARGHECFPVPNAIQQGQGICRTCAGNDPASARAAWLTRLAELGAEPIELYTTALTPTLIRCRNGHESRPQPSSVASGNGVCVTCAGKDPAVAEATFRARLTKAAATPLYEKWLGTNAQHHVRCASGHDCYPRPDSVNHGSGICRTCAGRDSAATEARFRARLAELGATPLYENWENSNRPHLVRCSKGHQVSPRPSDVLHGHDVCRKCAHRQWDAFYVVTSTTTVKFGVTSGDPQRRLRDHAAKGLDRVVRLAIGLPGSEAHAAEIAVRSALKLAGEQPIRGREYFDIACLALVLDVADGWIPAVQAHTEATR